MFLLRKLLYKAIKVNNWLLAVFTAVLVLSGAYLIYWLEPDNYQNYFNGLWWVMTTVTTVGYGDFYPKTVPGKWLAMFLYIVGIGLIGVVLGKVVEGLGIFRKRRLEGTMRYRGKGHIILVGWGSKARYLVEEILHTDGSTEVVIIDTLPEAPVLEERTHYIRGDAAIESTLEAANISEARSVIIFADDRIQDSALADGKSLLVATTVGRVAPEIHTNVEIKSDKHIKNFEHIRVNEFILSDSMISRLAARSTFYHGVTNVFRKLVSSMDGEDFHKISKKPHWNTYRDAYLDLLENGATLIADGQQLDINKKLDDPIPPKADLYIICDEETYHKIGNLNKEKNV